MPSEETSINLGEEPKSKIFDTIRISGRRRPVNPHERGGLSFAKVFANDLAAREIYRLNPNFPAGSIIVREKLLSETDAAPEIVAIMVKREKGFSKKTGDWEFFILDGTDLKLQKRETKGDCAKCHAQAEKTDWVFKNYLK
jgi:hypothetical protein